ncbi:hypothetical protein MH215_24585 [Paenibacillus sp. ACRSA]|uniref:hypothetical protein n=1 Tax=Paenibacillus sp. ACRSA TaxID=2918211 RepID=UPI001EF6B6C6|nr:hypothetical protein [Paenibacillus sp. ACRSA]MCG7380163.1 hypothetical protein [Paenibacillus sp. ACRSA]
MFYKGGWGANTNKEKMAKMCNPLLQNVAIQERYWRYIGLCTGMRSAKQKMKVAGNEGAV